MLSCRWARVVDVAPSHDGLSTLTVDVDGAHVPAVSYDAITAPPVGGDRVLVNTTAVELGLGTGGVHLVMAIAERDRRDPAAGHAIKLRYTPVQLAVEAIEDARPDAFDDPGLEGCPVVVIPLHSLLAPVTLAVREVAGGARIAFVMTDAAALPMAFSHTVPALRAAGLLDATVTAGQAFGGEFEAVNVFSGLVAARAVAGADVIIVGMGPGNLGTATALGTASLEVGVNINAVASLGGRAVVAPRLSFADPRERHRGVSHHTLTALTVAALARAEIAVPMLPPEEREVVMGALAPLVSRHDIVEIDTSGIEETLRTGPVAIASMGRRFEDDPAFFLAGAAAGLRASHLLSR